MPRGYRFIVAAVSGLALFTALGLGAFLGALYAPHYGYHAEHPSYRAADGEKHNPSQIDRERAGLPYFAERIASGPDPTEGSEKDKRDLAAQESMSVWAFWMMIVSAFSAVVTSIGTGFLLWQIILTRQAVEDTGEATEAMREANRIADEARFTQLRPYVFFDRAYFDFFNDGNECDIFIPVKNFGQTPAEVTITTARNLFDYPLDRAKIEGLVLSGPFTARIPPGRVRERFHFLWAAILTTIKNGEKVAVMRAHLSYPVSGVDGAFDDGDEALLIIDQIGLARSRVRVLAPRDYSDHPSHKPDEV